MSSPDENGDFVKLESSLSLKGKHAAMVSYPFAESYNVNASYFLKVSPVHSLCSSSSSVSLSLCAEVSHYEGANACVSAFRAWNTFNAAYNEAKINTRRRNLIGFILFFISSTAVLVVSVFS
ncbi:hypothetical protein Syun_021608 [Stephania yunnanensis]|uniref:Uncharacterized protein n=1 Tax=Stephania yunnanensis TaxID=152371 RepID=A0AAP0IHD8_9MAGN